MSSPTLRSAALGWPARLVPLLLVIGAVGCGGTNSETPWPVEPEDVDLGPEGEARKVEELRRPTTKPPAPPPADPTPGSTPAGGQF